MRKHLICVLLLCLLLCGCSKVESIKDKHEEDVSMFVKIEDAYNWSVYYHRDTKVMYVCSRGAHNSGVFTVMVDTDGKPLLWTGN